MNSEVLILIVVAIITSAVVSGAIIFLRRGREFTGAANDLTSEISQRCSDLEAELAQIKALYQQGVTALALSEQSLTELRQRYEQQGGELALVRRDLSIAQEGLASREATLSALKADLAKVSSERQTLMEKSEALLNANTELQKQQSALQSSLEAQGRAMLEFESRRKEDDVRLKEAFEGLSSKLLNENSAKFRESSREELGNILKPLKEALDTTKNELAKSKGEAEKQNQFLMQQVERIGVQAETLTKVFRGENIKSFGDLGENLLERVLQAAGLSRGTHYSTQEEFKGDDGERLRPDIIVKLPGDKSFVIDSKASLKNYNSAANTDDQALRKQLLEMQIKDIQTHVKGLASKHYGKLKGLNSPDFVMMYLPFEQAYIAAIELNPTLCEEAIAQGVAIVTNSTLLVALRTVSYVWTLERQQRSTAQIVEHAGKMLDKFYGFVGDLEDLGRALNSAQVQYSGAINKLSDGRGNLISRAHKLTTLGVKAKSVMPKLVAAEVEAAEVENLDADPGTGELLELGNEGEGALAVMESVAEVDEPETKEVNGEM